MWWAMSTSKVLSWSKWMTTWEWLSLLLLLQRDRKTKSVVNYCLHSSILKCWKVMQFCKLNHSLFQYYSQWTWYSKAKHIPVVSCNVWKSSIQVEKGKWSIYGAERKKEVKERMVEFYEESGKVSAHGQCLQECRLHSEGRWALFHEQWRAAVITGSQWLADFQPGIQALVRFMP